LKALKHGIAVFLPFLITYLVLKWVINILDSSFYPLINWTLNKLSFKVENKVIISFFEIFCFILFLFTIALIGKLTERKFFKNFLLYLEYIFFKIPLVKTVYNISSKFSKSIFSKDSMSFKKVVLVDFPRKGIKSLGFLVGETSTKKIGVGKFLVIVPSIPNPTTGFLLFIDKDDIEFVDMSVEDGIKTIFSGGIYLLEELDDRNK